MRSLLFDIKKQLWILKKAILGNKNELLHEKGVLENRKEAWEEKTF